MKFVVWFYFGAQKADVGYPFESDDMFNAMVEAREKFGNGEDVQFGPTTTGGFVSFKGSAITGYAIEAVKPK